MWDRTRNYAWFLYACVTRNPELPTIFPLTLPTTYITRGGFRAPAFLLTTLEPKEHRSKDRKTRVFNIFNRGESTIYAPEQNLKTSIEARSPQSERTSCKGNGGL